MPMLLGVGVESIDHLFFGCHIFGSFGSLIRQWMGILSMSPFQFSDHVLYFSSLCGYSKNIRSSMHIVWLATIWVI